MYRIEKADTVKKYEGLRSLWCRVFGDPPEFVDAVYEAFAGSIEGYVVIDEEDGVVSALSCYECGVFEGRPVHVSYAVCTEESHRGRGLAGMLTEHVRDAVLGRGGISIVSPADRGLSVFYARHGYEPFFFAAERAVLSPDLDTEDFDDFDDYDMDFGEEDFEAAVPLIEMKPVDAGVYGRYREAFLSVRPHIELSDGMLAMIAEDMGEEGDFYSVNHGDAICAVYGADPMRVVMAELIVNPVLQGISEDIDSEIASMIAKHFDAAEAVFRTPGPGSCQSMAAGIAGLGFADSDAEASVYGDDEECGYIYNEAYFGFPID